MPNTFDEASASTQEMFNENEQLSLSDAPLETEAQTTKQDTPPKQSAENPENAHVNETTSEQNMLDNAVNTAEVAAQAATEANREAETLKSQNEQLMRQNQQLQGTIDELSKQNQQNIVEEVLEPPTIDINALAFADEETVKAAQADYAAKMSEYNRHQIMKELSPAIEYAKEGMREKEKKEVISALSQIPELSGITDMLPQLEKIIANNKWLQSDDMPMDEKYISAFAIARGVNSINSSPSAPTSELTTDELMKLYNSNSEFQELIEKQRLEQIKHSQQVPPFSASSGAVNAALNIKNKPTTFEEASQRTRQMFGGM